MTDRIDISNLLQEMRAIKAQTNAFAPIATKNLSDVAHTMGPEGVGKADAPSFGSMFKQAVDSVNSTQKASASLTKAFEMGDPNVDLADVMIASEKAGVSFQAMLQVRNKLLEAYRDVLNMPI